MVAAGDPVASTDVNDAQLWRSAYTSMSTTKIEPLASASNTDTLITSVSATFKEGYAYEISWRWHAQMNGGTSPFMAYTKIKRTNASGTEIRGISNTTCITTNVCECNGSVIVKRTASGSTTQTIALIGGMASSGSPTSIDVEASSTRRTELVVRPIGLASDYSGAMEVPTA